LSAAPPSQAANEASGDEALVSRAKAGDRRAFDALVLRYQDRIVNLCYQKLGDRDEAQDAAQEAFLKAYKALAAFEEKARFFTWLFRIAVNCAFTRRRRRGLERETTPVRLDQAAPGASEDDDGRMEAPDLRDEPQARALESEQSRRVAEAIDGLESDHKKIVLLRDVEGLAYEEIAEVLDLPIGSVKSRLHRARLVLREKLKAYLSI